MAGTNSLSSVTTRAGSFVANHPRFAVTLVFLVLLVAAQGTVGAETATIDPSGGHNVDMGP